MWAHSKGALEAERGEYGCQSLLLPPRRVLLRLRGHAESHPRKHQSGHRLVPACPNDSGITEYKVQWKSGTQDWSETRQNTATASPNTITGLTNDTLYYVRVRAENDFGSGDWSDIATGTPSALTASTVTSAGAKLTIADHSGIWHYKETHPSTTASCSDEISAGTSTATLSSLTANTAYAYTAYSDSGCTAANALGTAYFSTRLTVGNLDEDSSGIGCAVNVNSKCAVGFTTGSNSGGYTLASFTASFLINEVSGSGDIVVTLHADNSGAPASAVLATLTGSNPDIDTAGDYTYTCSGSGCALSPGTNYFAQFAGTGQITYRWDTTHSDSETTVPTGTGWNIADRVDHYKNGSWVDYSDTGVIEVAAGSNPSLAASSVTADSATLTLSHNAAPWWLKRTTPADTACTSKGTASTHSLANLTAGTSYTYAAYRDSGCAEAALASVTFDTPTSGP